GGARLMSLNDPRKKMSKSYGEKSYIALSDSPETIWKKLAVAVTDPARVTIKDPGTPEICNIYHLHQLFSSKKQIDRVADACRNAKFGCLDCKKILWENIVEELKFTSLHNRIVGYHNLMRNGIAHGGITYLEREIKYTDKRGNEETIYAPDVLRKFDDLLDVCNSLTLAFSIFIFLNEPKGYLLPPHTLYEELKASTKTPYWEVIACIPTETMKGSQLVVYAKASTSDYDKVYMSAIQTGILAAFLSTGYDRYFVSIRSRKALPGWAAFDGKRLSKLAKRDDISIQDFAGVLEEGLVFYVPKVKLPKILSRINTYLISLKIQISLAKIDFQRNLGLTIIKIRNASMHRHGWRIVLKGEVVVLPEGGDIKKEEIYSSLRRITRKAAKRARKICFQYNLHDVNI
ncbi:MAG: hypothetical protein IH947_11820, partial [Bacteroidetes bacterium]|nr:hypothetical protein [Bacteroidota bacterium]